MPPGGPARRPDTADDARSFTDLAYTLVRVLDDDGRAVGPWDPKLSPDLLRRMLRSMALLRAFDERMFRAQRQGKTSFYMKATGEEAVAVAAGATRSTCDDMCFPSYRQQGLLHRARLSDGRDDEPDLLEQGRQAAGQAAADHVFGEATTASSRSRAIWRRNIPQAVGWAMASAAKGDTRIAAVWCGEGSTAEGDFHSACTFASVYRAPVHLQRRQQPVGDLQLLGLRRGGGDDLRGARGRLWHRRAAGRRQRRAGGLRGDEWAAERARTNQGPTLIEHFTYRAEGHSTSDDPGQYRSEGEPNAWPLGDPIKRLKDHLIALGEWDEERHAAQDKELAEAVKAAQKEAEKNGILGHGLHQPLDTLFDGVFEEMPWHLREQQAQMMAEEEASGRPWARK